MPDPGIILVEAKAKDDFNEASILFREYESGLGIDLGFQNFREELETISIQYGKPNGVLILAKSTELKIIGCAGVRRYEGSICELKRMYIKPEARGLGLGKILLRKSVEIATELGYSKMRLDILPDMKKAIKMYEREQFHEIEAYRYNPVKGARYYEKDLTY